MDVNVTKATMFWESSLIVPILTPPPLAVGKTCSFVTGADAFPPYCTSHLWLSQFSKPDIGEGAFHMNLHHHPTSHNSSILFFENRWDRDARRDRQSSAPIYAPHILLSPSNADRPCITRQLSMTGVNEISQYYPPSTVPGLS